MTVANLDVLIRIPALYEALIKETIDIGKGLPMPKSQLLLEILKSRDPFKLPEGFSPDYLPWQQAIRKVGSSARESCTPLQIENIESRIRVVITSLLEEIDKLEGV